MLVPIESPCDFLFVTNNLLFCMYRFEVIADYCSNYVREAVTLRF